MGLPRPPGSPITLPATSCGHTLPVVIAPRPCAGPGADVTTHPFAPDGRQRPGETPVRTAVSPRLLIRPPWPGAATRDENRWARPSSALLGAAEPVDKTDAGAFPAPRTVAVSTRFSVVDSVGPAGRHPRDGGGVDGGAGSPALRRVGCRQGRGGGLRARARRGRWPRPGGADVPDLHLGAGGAGWVAGR